MRGRVDGLPDGHGRAEVAKPPCPRLVHEQVVALQVCTVPCRFCGMQHAHDLLLASSAKLATRHKHTTASIFALSHHNTWTCHGSKHNFTFSNVASCSMHTRGWVGGIRIWLKDCLQQSKTKLQAKNKHTKMHKEALANKNIKY